MPGHFIVQAYPVILSWSDVLLTASGVTLIGYLIALIPASKSISHQYPQDGMKNWIWAPDHWKSSLHIRSCPPHTQNISPQDSVLQHILLSSQEWWKQELRSELNLKMITKENQIFTIFINITTPISSPYHRGTIFHWIACPAWLSGKNGIRRGNYKP